MPSSGYRKTEDLPKVIPVFPLDGVLLLPGGQLPLNIFEPRYLNMVDDAMAGDRVIGIIQTLGGQPSRPSLAPVGCLGRITSFAETSDGRYLITLTGVCRFNRGEELPSRSPYRQTRAAYEVFGSDLHEDDEEGYVDREALLSALKKYLSHRGLGVDWKAALQAPAEGLINSLCMALPFEPAEKQALLEAAGLTLRAETLTALLEIGAAGDDDEGTLLQ